MLKFKRDDDERGKVIVIEEPHGLIKHARWPSLAQVVKIASQEFPGIPQEQLSLIFFTDSRGHAYLQIYKRG
ncbi:MAG: hypothetical protein Q8R36_05265 [bacterium]|nr:hypothetical protein [bacterium]